MSSQNVLSPSNVYVINVEGANNRRKLFNNNSDYFSTSNILQRKGSDGIDINSYSQDFNALDNIFSNQSLKNREVEISERQDKGNSRLEFALEEQLSRNLDLTTPDRECVKKNSIATQIARTKSKKEINYNDIQQIIKSNQKKGTSYIQNKMKTMTNQQQLKNQDMHPFSLGNGVAAEYYEYENNQPDEVQMTRQNEEGYEGVKLKNQIIIFSYLLQFVKALLVRYMYKEHKMLSVLQYRIIGDNAIIIEKNQRKRIDEIQKVKHRNIFERINFIRQMNLSGSNVSKYDRNSFLQQFSVNVLLSLKKILKKCFKQLIIVKPNNPFILIWEMIYLIAILFFLVIIPLEWSFNLPNQQKVLTITNYLQVGVFAMDMIIGFHTGFYEFGEIVMSRSRILHKYFQEKFKSNFISLSLIVVNLILEINFLNFLALLIMINSITEKMERINLNLQLYQKLSSFQELGKLFLLILLSIHIFGCGFHYVGSYSEEIGITDNWIRETKLLNKSIGERYLNSIYYTLISMITIGYGDIHPYNVYEKIYTFGMSFISCGLFAFSVNLIGTIITDIKKKTKEFRNKQYVISCYMNDRQVQKSTQMRVLKYLEFIEDFQDQNITEGAKIIESCSQEIKEELLKEYYGRILKNIKLIKATFSQEFLTQLSLIMKERRFAPGEILVQKGQQLKHLFFITKGQTEYFIANNGNFLNLCDYDEKMIDLKCFITQQPSEISVRSKGITTAAYVEYSQWQDLIKQFHQDKEKVCCLRDQFLYDKRYQYPCKSCGQYQHNIFNCPQVCFKVNRSIFFNKLTLPVQQERNPYTQRRDKKKKVSSYVNNEITRQGLKLLRWNLVKEIYEDYEETDVQQECAMIEKDREFYFRCPKIKNSYFRKRDKQKDIVQYNHPLMKIKGISKQRSESNFFYNQKESSSSSSSSCITSSESDENSSSSELPGDSYHNQAQQQGIFQQDQGQILNNNNNILSANLQPMHIPLDSKFDYSEIAETNNTSHQQQYSKKVSGEFLHHPNHFIPRHSKSNGRTPINSRAENFDSISQNIINSPNPSYFYEQNSQKFGDDLNPQTYQYGYPSQQFSVMEKIVNQRRSILNNGQNNILKEKYLQLYQQSQLQQLQSQQNQNFYNSPNDKQNPQAIKFTFENSRSLQDDDPYIQASSQLNSMNNLPQQQPIQQQEQNSGTPVVTTLNSIIGQMQNQIERFYFQVTGLQQQTNQQFIQQNIPSNNRKKRKAIITRFNLPSNLTPNEKSNQSENSVNKEHNRQISISSSHNYIIPKENQKDNSLKADTLSNGGIQKLHIFGKFEFFFDIAKEFQYYYPKYNQSNIVKAYKKYQFMIFNQFKDQTMSKKATSLKATIHQSTRRKFHKKASLAPLKRNNIMTFIH